MALSSPATSFPSGHVSAKADVNKNKLTKKKKKYIQILLRLNEASH